MRKLFVILCLFAMACEPIGAVKKEEPKSAEELSSEEGLSITVPDGTTTTDTSNSYAYKNLSTALRIQYLEQVVKIFRNLKVKVGDDVCNLGQSLSISIPGEITDNAFDTAFNNISTALEDCMSKGDDKIKIKAAELQSLEQQIQAATGANILPACNADSQCAQLPESGFFKPLAGAVYSKKIHATESEIIQEKLRALIISFSDNDNTDYTGFEMPVSDDIDQPVFVPSCVSNVCRGANR